MKLTLATNTSILSVMRKLVVLDDGSSHVTGIFGGRFAINMKLNPVNVRQDALVLWQHILEFLDAILSGCDPSVARDVGQA